VKIHDIVWTLAAESDVQTIYEEFERREEGKGDILYAEVLRVTRLLADHPMLGASLGEGRFRRVLVYNRHYGLYYVPEVRGIILHAFLDLRRDPEMIARRLRDL